MPSWIVSHQTMPRLQVEQSDMKCLTVPTFLCWQQPLVFIPQPLVFTQQLLVFTPQPPALPCLPAQALRLRNKGPPTHLYAAAQSTFTPRTYPSTTSLPPRRLSRSEEIPMLLLLSTTVASRSSRVLDQIAVAKAKKSRQGPA